MSESILLLNPRRKIKARRRRTNRRHRHRRRLPAALAAYARRTNRRHSRRINRRRRARRINPRGNRRRGTLRRYARRRFRSVARGAGRYGRGILGDYVIPGTIGAAGALTLDVIWGYVSQSSMVPPSLKTGWVALGAKLGVVIGVCYAVKRFKPAWGVKAHTAAVGAATVALYGALKGVAQSLVPSGVQIPGLSGYMDYQSYALPGTRMHGYMPRAGLGDLGDFFSPAAVIQPMGTPVPRQFGGYIAAQPGMAGYMQPHMASGGGLMGYDWQNDGM